MSKRFSFLIFILFFICGIIVSSNTMGWAYLLSIIFIISGSSIFYNGFNRMHKYRLIMDIPRSKISSLAMGLVELHGSVTADKFIKTPFSQKNCVYYHYEIEEYRKQKRGDYSWDIVSEGEQRVPFHAKDETGSILVDPQGLEYHIRIKNVYKQKAGLFGDTKTIVNSLKDWDNNKQIDLQVNNWGLTPVDTKPYPSYSTERNSRSFHFDKNDRGGDRKYLEYYIEPEEQLFVIGTAENKPKSNDVFIHKGVNEPTFIISDRSEKDILKSIKKNMTDSFIWGALFIIAGVSILLLLSLGII